MLSSSDSTTLDLWLNSQTSPHTRSCYRRDADRLLAHVGKPLNAIGLGDLQDFDQSLVKAGLAPVSRVRTLAAIKSLFSFCCRTRYLPANPATELTLPPYEQRLAERIVAEEDVQRLLAVDMPLRDQVLLQLLYTAGLRVSEACGLRWRNLSARGEAGQVSVFGKNGRTRAVALPPEVWKMLNKLQKSAETGTPVFASRSGQPLDRGRVRVILREAAEKAGVAGKTPQSSPHLAASRTRLPRPGPRRAHPPGTSHPGPLFGGHHVPFTSTPGRATPARASSEPKHFCTNLADRPCLQSGPE